LVCVCSLFSYSRSQSVSRDISSAEFPLPILPSSPISRPTIFPSPRYDRDHSQPLLHKHHHSQLRGGDDTDHHTLHHLRQQGNTSGAHVNSMEKGFQNPALFPCTSPYYYSPTLSPLCMRVPTSFAVHVAMLIGGGHHGCDMCVSADAAHTPLHRCALMSLTYAARSIDCTLPSKNEDTAMGSSH